MADAIETYFDTVEKEVQECYDIAGAARAKNLDPDPVVDVKLARNMAERVEGLISSAAPQLIGTNLTKRIMELEEKFSPLDWRVALAIAVEVAEQKFCEFKDLREACEVGIRTGFAYHTGGVVSAPLEGFVELRIKKTKDGKDYFAPCYAGPIRGAGGTAAAFSLLLADYVRVKMGFAKYDPSEEEALRYVSEVNDYNDRITNLQYNPSDDEVLFLAQRIPIEIDGDPTEKIEVSNHKDLSRVQTNRIRGGVCLVMAEGLSQKAPKLWKRLEKWGKDFDLEWDFLKEFLALQKQKKAQSKKKETKQKLTPNFTYLADLAAGRPILAYPMQVGGFRLRYGRSRVSGFSAASIHPATMVLLKSYIAIGTQLKLERPGKAAAMTPVDSIEGPIVCLKSGEVIKLTSVSLAKQHKDNIERIIYLGDILFNYGDFSENGHALVPCGYNEEWWLLELHKAVAEKESKEKAEELVKKHKNEITLTEALSLSEGYTVPLHPKYTFFWNALTVAELRTLISRLSDSTVQESEGKTKIIAKKETITKASLEKLGIPHLIAGEEFIVVNHPHSHVLLTALGKPNSHTADDVLSQIIEDKDVLSNVNHLSPFVIRDKLGTFIGGRMGRPEKAKMRKMTGSPHVLFPVGEEGGRLRSFQAALDEGKVTSSFPFLTCTQCKKETVYNTCEVCGGETSQQYNCRMCGPLDTDTCPRHGDVQAYKEYPLDITHYFQDAVTRANLTIYPDLIKGVRGTSNRDHLPENLIKGVLRAKNEIFVNKDGTTRFDLSELPITHFKPKEVRTSVEKLKELGYEVDYKGNPLVDDDQLVELFPQDVILPSSTEALEEQADSVLVKVANFVDDLLVNFYEQEPYYNAATREDIVGHLVIGLAPHTSAGTVGRIVGFSAVQGLLAHPMFHAGMRRDCDGDEAGVILLLDGLLNFSRRYLPDSRGAKTMDAPLVLRSKIIPSEVDDQVHGIDVVDQYPLALYEAAQEYKYPWEVKVEQLNARLHTPQEYKDFLFTHDTSNINAGVLCSAYKFLPSMEEKLGGQMELATMIDAVDQRDVARLVIEKHFLKDAKGNLRKFSMQQFRCVKCNTKYRRPPLKGVCENCGGKLIFTISEGSVVKYFQPSLDLAENYDVSPYLKQVLMILQRRIEGVFGKEKETQEALSAWVT